MSNPTTESPARPIAIAAIAMMLIERLTTEAITTPRKIAIGYAILLASVVTGWWYHRQQNDYRNRSSAEAVNSTALVLATILSLLALRSLECLIWRDKVPPITSLTASAIALQYVIRPLAEEGSLRVYLTDKLTRFGSTRDVILLNGVISAALSESLYYGVSNFTLGATLAFIVIRTKRPWLAPMIHVPVAVMHELAKSKLMDPYVATNLTAVGLALIAAGFGYIIFRTVPHAAAEHVSIS